MTLDDLEQKLRSQLPRLKNLKATVRFEIDGVGFLFLDATGSAPVLGKEDREAACTIRVTSDNLLRLMDGSLDPTMAYATGRLKIKGSMGVALKLGSLLSDEG